MLKRLLSRGLSILLGRRRIKVHVIHSNGLFALLPDDIWMLLVNEWLDHVKLLTALEIAMGKENISKWIYTLYHRLSIPITLNSAKYSSFKSWKEHRGLQSFEHVILCESTRFSTIPWQQFGGLKRLEIVNKFGVYGSRMINISHLLTMLPVLQELSIDVSYFIPDKENIAQSDQHHQQLSQLAVPSLLKSLKLSSDLYVKRAEWKSVMKYIAETMPNLETFQIDNADTCPFRCFLDTLLTLHNLTQWTLICKFLRRRRDSIYFENFDEEEWLELRHVPTTIPSATLLPSLTPAATYPWESVHIQFHQGKYINEEDQYRLLSMLCKCHHLHTLHIQGQVYFPRTFPPLSIPSPLTLQETITSLRTPLQSLITEVMIEDCPWKCLRVLELKYTLISNDFMCALIHCCGHQLTTLSVEEVPYPPDHPPVPHVDGSDTETDLTTMRTVHYEWIGLLKDHCPVLRTLVIGQFPFTHEQDIVQHLLSSSLSNFTTSTPPVYATTLTHYQVHFLNSRLFTNPTLFSQLLSPFHSLHTIHISVDEKAWYTDCVSLLFRSCNASILQVFHFEFTQHRQKRLRRGSLSHEYQLQVQSMSNTIIIQEFPNLKSITMINCLVVDEVISWILTHAPRLDTVLFHVTVLSRKMVIIPTHFIPSPSTSLSTASANAIVGDMHPTHRDSHQSRQQQASPYEESPSSFSSLFSRSSNKAKTFVQKDIYYQYNTMIKFMNVEALRVLLQPPHFHKLGAYMRRGGVCSLYSTGTTLDSAPIAASDTINLPFRVLVSYLQVQRERRLKERNSNYAYFPRNHQKTVIEVEEEMDEEIEEELFRGAATEEVLLGYVTLSVEEEKKVENEYKRRNHIREEQVRLDMEERNVSNNLPLREWILRLQQRSRQVYIAEDDDNVESENS